MKIDWTFLPVEISGPVRWIAQTSGDPVLAMIQVAPTDPGVSVDYETSFVSLTLGSVEFIGHPVMQIAAGPDVVIQILPTKPNWDLVSYKNTSRLAVEKFGGATTGIGVHDGQQDFVIKPAALQSFTQPRFVRSTATSAPNALTAVSIDNTLLHFDLDLSQPAGRRLGKAQSGQVWQAGKKKIVFLNRAIDAKMSRLGENPADLSMETRSDLFTPVSGIQLGEGHHTYQFDGLIVQNEVYVLLVTNRGPGICKIPDSGRGAAEYFWFPISGSVASSPTLMAAGNVLWIALIEYEDLIPIGVRLGSTSLS